MTTSSLPSKCSACPARPGIRSGVPGLAARRPSWPAPELSLTTGPSPSSSSHSPARPYAPCAAEGASITAAAAATRTIGSRFRSAIAQDGLPAPARSNRGEREAWTFVQVRRPPLRAVLVVVVVVRVVRARGGILWPGGAGQRLVVGDRAGLGLVRQRRVVAVFHGGRIPATAARHRGPVSRRAHAGGEAADRAHVRGSAPAARWSRA